MDVISVASVQRFMADKMQKVGLFETDRMFCDVYCFEPGQSQAPHAHDGADKIYFVLSGQGLFRVGDQEHRLSPQQATLAPSGSDHGVINDSDERLVVLVFMAPHPGRKSAPVHQH